MLTLASFQPLERSTSSVKCQTKFLRSKQIDHQVVFIKYQILPTLIIRIVFRPVRRFFNLIKITYSKKSRVHLHRQPLFCDCRVTIVSFTAVIWIVTQRFSPHHATLLRRGMLRSGPNFTSIQSRLNSKSLKISNRFELKTLEIRLENQIYRTISETQSYKTHLIFYFLTQSLTFLSLSYLQSRRYNKTGKQEACSVKSPALNCRHARRYSYCIVYFPDWLTTIGMSSVLITKIYRKRLLLSRKDFLIIKLLYLT